MVMIYYRLKKTFFQDVSEIPTAKLIGCPGFSPQCMERGKGGGWEPKKTGSAMNRPMWKLLGSLGFMSLPSLL